MQCNLTMDGKKRKSLTLDEKVELIRASEIQKLPAKALQELFQCGKTTVYDTLQRKAQIMDYWMKGLGSRKRRIWTKHEKINQLTWEWFMTARSKNIPIDGPTLQAKAKEIAEQQGDFLFKASNGWLESFKNRHNVRWKEIRGEFNYADVGSVQKTSGETHDVNVKSIQETSGKFNYVNIGNVQEMCGEFHSVKGEIDQEMCEEFNDVNVEDVQEKCRDINCVDVGSAQELCGEFHNVKDEIVQETCEESDDVDVESIQETCGEYNYINIGSVQELCDKFHSVKEEIVQETSEEANDVNIKSVQEISKESHNGHIDTESDNISGIDIEEDINETVPSVHTYTKALQYIRQLQKFALAANNPELLQSFSTSKNLIEQELIHRKIKKEKILDVLW